jgi:hypothetical protein
VDIYLGCPGSQLCYNGDMNQDYQLPLPHPDIDTPIYDELYIQHLKWLDTKSFGEAPTTPAEDTNETPTPPGGIDMEKGT